MLERSLSTIDKDGNLVERWNFRDAATFVSQGTKLARQAAELFDSDLNAALAVVERFYDDLPKAIAQYQKSRQPNDEIIHPAGTPEHYLQTQNWESFRKATEGQLFEFDDDDDDDLDP